MTVAPRPAGQGKIAWHQSKGGSRLQFCRLRAAGVAIFVALALALTAMLPIDGVVHDGVATASSLAVRRAPLAGAGAVHLAGSKLDGGAASSSNSSGTAAPAPYYQSDMIAGLLRVAQPVIRSAYGPYEYYNVSVDDGALRAHLAAAGLAVPDAGAFQELSRWGRRCGAVQCYAAQPSQAQAMSRCTLPATGWRGGRCAVEGGGSGETPAGWPCRCAAVALASARQAADDVSGTQPAAQ